MYKQAAQLGLRFTTSVGSLSTEQLFQLNQTQLANAVRNQKKVLKKTDDDELSFLDTSSKVDVMEQLRFDILKDVYLTKKEEAKAISDARETKEHNAKIDALIANKQEQNLANLSIDELEKLRK